MLRVALALLAMTAHAQVWPFPGPGKASLASAACTPVSGYSHCRVITISAAQAGTVDSANWPVSVVTTLGASRITDAQCDDVVFTSDSGGTTLIPWQIEVCVQSTGAIVAWVQLANLSVSTDSKVYVSYQNAAVTTAQNTGGLTSSVIWGASPTYHLPDGTGLNVNDSGTSAATLSNVGTSTPTAGEIDGGVAFNGTTQYLLRTASTPITGPPVTMSAWFNTTAFPPVNSETIMALGNTITNDDWIRIIINGPAATVYADSNSLGGAGYAAINGTTVLSTNTWYYASVVYASGSILLYLNGGLQGTGTYTTAPAGINCLAIGLTYKSGPIDFFAGKIDEARMDATARTASWLLSNYNSQKPSQTMVTVGSEI